MKLSAILCKQHIGKYFKKHWAVQGKRKILKTPAEGILSKAGIPVYDPKDIYQEARNFERVEIVGFKPVTIKFDETHPNWHDEPLLTCKDDNVLLEGLKQAQVLTNTVASNALPEKYEITSNSLGKDLNQRVKNIILSSHIFDAQQEKLPKRKDPNRPAWNFPRDYGVTHQRRNKLMTSKLLHLLETNENHEIVKERYIFNDLFFSFPFKKHENSVQLEFMSENVLTSSKPLSPIQIDLQLFKNEQLPNLHPIKCTVSMNEENIYEIRNMFPISKKVRMSHPHTVFVHYDKTKVKNLFEEEVTDVQIHGRSLLKTFTVAASYARQRFGENIEDLPEPVTLQCVQTDGQWFQFGVLQLNTLNLNDNNLNNLWFQTDLLQLFQNCQIQGGRPILKEYNEDVVKHLVNFYKNQ